MRFFLLVSLFLAAASQAFAGYDNTWYKTEFWSGEYPNGIAVVKRHTTVAARAAMDKDVAPTLKCALPYKAVFQPWNGARNKKNHARYFTASKIVTLVAKEDFTFEPDNGEKLPVKKGQELEYLIYGAEGFFSVRYNGKEYTAGQELFEKVESVPDSAFHQDEWLKLTCENGVRGWVLRSDLVKTDDAGNTVYAPGIGDWGPGLQDYGKSHDLP